MNLKLTTFGSKNLVVYYIFPFLFGSWLVIPNWVFFYSKYISLAEIGLIDAIAIAIGVVAEVPTGVFSDLFGKKISIIIAKVIMALGFLVTGFAYDFITFFVGAVAIFIGFAFQSGALEAFAYDTLADLKQEKSFDLVISRFSFLETIAMFIWMVLGGVLFTYNPRLVFFVATILELLAAVMFLFASEPKVDTLSFSIKNYLKQTKEGFLHLFNPKLAHYLWPILLTASFIFLSTGVVRQNSAAYFGFSGESFSYVYAVINLVGALVILKFEQIKQYLGEKKFLLIILLGFSMTCFFAWLKPQPYFSSGVIFFLSMILFSKFSNALNSSVINRHIESRYRSTTLSSLQLISKIPYIILMLMFVNWFSISQIGYSFLLLGIILSLSFVLSGWILYKNVSPFHK